MNNYLLIFLGRVTASTTCTQFVNLRRPVHVCGTAMGFSLLNIVSSSEPAVGGTTAQIIPDHPSMEKYGEAFATVRESSDLIQLVLNYSHSTPHFSQTCKLRSSRCGPWLPAKSIVTRGSRMHPIVPIVPTMPQLRGNVWASGHPAMRSPPIETRMRF